MATPTPEIVSPETMREIHGPEYYSSDRFLPTSTPAGTIQWLQHIGQRNAASLQKLRIWVDACYMPARKQRSNSALAAMSPDMRQILKLGAELFKPDGPEWCDLFAVIARDATGLRELEVHWDCAPDCGKFGGGFDVELVRAVGTIRGLEKLKLSGCYAKEWPVYLRQKTGAEVVEQGEDEMKGWEIRHFRKHQGGHVDLRP